jgi:hypothetical protein
MTETKSAYIAHPEPLKRMNWRIAALLAALFVFSLVLNTFHNGFPYFYHADEPGKVRQIIGHERNFNHPLFMLEMAQGTAAVLRTPMRAQDVVELGRWLSALYLALSVVCVAWLVWQWFHPVFAGVAGVLLALAPDYIELSHFFKEDAALAMGITLFFVAAQLWEARGRWRRLLLFGVVAGLCASTKYVGLAAIPLGLFLIWWRAFELRKGGPAGHWRRMSGQLGIYALGAVLAFGAINYPMLTHQADAARSFNRETELVMKGQGKMRKSVPHTGFIERFLARAGILLPGYIVGLVIIWGLSRHRKHWRTQWLFILFPLLLTLLLSFSAKDSGRYFLPAIPGIVALGSVGMGFILLALWNWRPVYLRAVPVLLAIAVLVLAGERAWTYLDGFRRDARLELLQQLEKTPANSVLMQGDRIFLPAPDHRYADAWRVKAPREIRTVKSVADQAETPAQLRGKGVTHVALNYSEFNRYIAEDGRRPSEDSVEEFERRRAFYRELFEKGRLIWQSREAKIGPNNPELRLYEVP